MIEQPQISTLQAAQQILRAFRLDWKLFLGIHIAVNVFSLLVLVPLFGLIVGWLLLASGNSVLTDEDILYFVVSPAGMLVLLLVGALYALLAIFQQAAMITAGHHVAAGRAVSLPGLSRQMLMKSWSLFRLALQMIGRTAALITPFLAVSALIYHSLLTEFDINYYLTDRPPAFWLAGGLILVCLLTMAGVLLRIFSGWVLALPLLLLTEQSPAGALKLSHKASVSMRSSISITLLVLFVLNAGVLGFVSLLTDLSLDVVVALGGDSLQAMAYLLGGLLVVWLAANTAITFFANSILSLVILFMYTRLIHTGDHKGLGESPTPRRSSRPWRVSGAWLVASTLIVSVSAGLGVDIIMERLELNDHTVVIAHRGASADAPENTLAAMELAINEGADWVEIDVQETRDGEIVVIHDKDLKKAGGSGLRVYEASLAQLQAVDIGSWKDPSFNAQRVPTLQQLLALCKDRVNVLIELKYYGQEEHLEEYVTDIVEATGMQDQVMVMSLNYPGIQKMKSIRPDWNIGLLSSVAVGDITRLQADFFAINAKFATREFIKRAHQRNRKVMVWTVNDPISMSAMMSKGVDGIITDRPGLASMVRAERAELGTHERVMIQVASLIGRQPVRPEQ